MELLSSQSTFVDNAGTSPENIVDPARAYAVNADVVPENIASIVRNEVKQAISEVAASRMEAEARKALDAASANAYASWESQAKARFEAQMKGFATQFEKCMETRPGPGRASASPEKCMASPEKSIGPTIDLVMLQAQMAETEKDLRDRIVVMEVAVMGLSQKGGELRDELQRALDAQRAAMEGALDAQRSAMEGMQQKIVFADKKLEVFIERVMDGFENMMDSLDNKSANPVLAPEGIQGVAENHSVPTDSNLIGNRNPSSLQQTDPHLSESLRVLHQNLLAMNVQDRPWDMSGRPAVEQQSKAPQQQPMFTRSFTSPGIQSRSSTPDGGLRYGASLTMQQSPSGVASSTSQSAQSLRIAPSSQSLSVGPSLSSLQAISTQISAGLAAGSALLAPVSRQASSPGAQLSRQISSPNPQLSRQVSIPSPVATPRIAQRREPNILQSAQNAACQRVWPQQPSPTPNALVERRQSQQKPLDFLQPALQGLRSHTPNALVERRQSQQKPLDLLQPALQGLRKTIEVPPQLQQPLQTGGPNAIERLQSLQKEQMQCLQKEHAHSLQLEQLRPGHIARLAGTAAFNALSQLSAPKAPSAAAVARKPQAPSAASVAASPLRRPILGTQQKPWSSSRAAPSPRPTPRGALSPSPRGTVSQSSVGMKRVPTEVDIDTGSTVEAAKGRK